MFCFLLESLGIVIPKFSALLLKKLAMKAATSGRRHEPNRTSEGTSVCTDPSASLHLVLFGASLGLKLRFALKEHDPSIQKND